MAAPIVAKPDFVIGDMITPLKAVIGEAYKSVEARLAAARACGPFFVSRAKPRNRAAS